jgi:hypothetical protein
MTNVKVMGYVNCTHWPLQWWNNQSIPTSACVFVRSSAIAWSCLPWPTTCWWWHSSIRKCPVILFALCFLKIWMKDAEAEVWTRPTVENDT